MSIFRYSFVYILLYEYLNVTEPTRQEACGPICKAFIQGSCHKTSKVYALADRYNRGKTKSNPRASVGLRSAEKYSTGQGRYIITGGG